MVETGRISRWKCRRGNKIPGLHGGRSGKIWRERFPSVLPTPEVQRSGILVVVEEGPLEAHHQGGGGTDLEVSPLSTDSAPQEVGLGEGGQVVFQLAAHFGGVRESQEENLRDPGETLRTSPLKLRPSLVVSPQMRFAPYKSPRTPSNPLTPSTIKSRRVGSMDAAVPAEPPPPKKKPTPV